MFACICEIHSDLIGLNYASYTYIMKQIKKHVHFSVWVYEFLSLPIVSVFRTYTKISYVSIGKETPIDKKNTFLRHDLNISG